MERDPGSDHRQHPQIVRPVANRDRISRRYAKAGAYLPERRNLGIPPENRLAYLPGQNPLMLDKRIRPMLIKSKPRRHLLREGSESA